MTVEVRRAALDDAADRERLLVVLDEYLVDPAIGGSAWGPEVRSSVVPGLADAAGIAFLAFDGGDVVGAAVCLPGYSTFWAKPLLNVHDLAVVGTRRGQGIGRRLLEAVEAEARRRGCCKVTLEVLESNTRARGLYDSYGFGVAPSGDAQHPTWFLEKGLL